MDAGCPPAAAGVAGALAQIRGSRAQIRSSRAQIRSSRAQIRGSRAQIRSSRAQIRRGERNWRAQALDRLLRFPISPAREKTPCRRLDVRGRCQLESRRVDVAALTLWRGPFLGAKGTTYQNRKVVGWGPGWGPPGGWRGGAVGTAMLGRLRRGTLETPPPASPPTPHGSIPAEPPSPLPYAPWSQPLLRRASGSTPADALDLSAATDLRSGAR